MISCFTNVDTSISHIIDLPPCCPVSKNPRAGSILRVSYRPNGQVIPVEDLASTIKEYIGGHKTREIRNMEEMVQDLALRFSAMVNVPVLVVAELVIAVPGHPEHQRMRISAGHDGSSP